MTARKKGTARKRIRRSDTTVWHFCRHPERLYVRVNMPRKAFVAATQKKVLSFNKGNMPNSARKAEIEIFAKRLHFHMQSVDYEPMAGARATVRASVKTADDKIKKLLDAVAKSYKRRRR